MNLAVASDVPPAAELTVSANVATSDPDQHLEDSTDRIIIVVAPVAADLSVGSSLDAVPLTIGGPVKFTAEVSNLGTTVASASALVLTLPPKVVFKSGDPAPTATSGDTVTWQLGDIAPGSLLTIAVTIVLDASLAATALNPENLLKFKLDASTTSTQVSPANNHLEIEKQVEQAGPNLKVWLSVHGGDDPGELPIGKDATYTITYGNYGNAPASKVTVTLTLPDGLDLVSAMPAAARTNKSDKSDPSISSWGLGDLGVGDSGIIKSQIHVTSIGPDGSLVSAEISAAGNDVPSREKIAYSLQRAAKSGDKVADALRRQVAARGGHTMLWLLLIAVLALVVVWAVRRARSKPAS